jgi:hypothetical protein
VAIGRLAFEFREMHLRVARMPDHGVAFLGPESDASCHTQLIVYVSTTPRAARRRARANQRREIEQRRVARCVAVGPGADVCTIMQLAPPTPPRPSASHVRLRTSYPCELNTCKRPGRRPTGAPPYAMCHAPDSAPYAHAPMRPPTRASAIPPAPPPANWANDQPLG